MCVANRFLVQFLVQIPCTSNRFLYMYSPLSFVVCSSTSIRLNSTSTGSYYYYFQYVLKGQFIVDEAQTERERTSDGMQAERRRNASGAQTERERSVEGGRGTWAKLQSGFGDSSHPRIFKITIEVSN